MKLAPRELDHLTIFTVAQLARRRRDRGTRLNYEEAIAIICDEILEGARDGRTVAELMSYGREVVTAEQCMDGVPDLVHVVQVECTFPDGTKLVSVHEPIQPSGDTP
ncbi:MAG: urease subunit gamma [Acidimicrobiales bacterium]